MTTVFLAGLGLGILGGMVLDAWIIPWLAHEWALRRAHVRFR